MKNIISNKYLIINILIWYISNYCFTIYNKKLFFDNEDNLILFGTLYLLIGFIYLIINIFFRNNIFIDYKKINIIKCIKISICTLICHILSIYSINLNTIFINQVIRSTEPVINLALRYYLYSESINKNKLIPIIFIIIGTIISIFDFTDYKNIKLSCNYYGIIYGLSSNLFSSFKSIETNNYIKKYPNNILTNNYFDNIYNFYFLVNLVTSFFCLLFLFWSDNNSYNKFINLSTKKDLLIVLVGSGICFHISNLYSTVLNYLTNPYTQIILASSKRIIILGISKLIFNEKTNIYQLIGFIISIGSIIINFIIR